MEKWMQNLALSIALVLNCIFPWSISGAEVISASDSSTIVIRDLSRFEPQAHLSNSLQANSWQILSYEAEGISGNMIGALALSEPPDITLSLRAKGWHKVYIGYWNPMFTFDFGTMLKLKLTDDACFETIIEGSPEAPAETVWQTSIRETLWKSADLTGQDLIFRKVRGMKAFLAYVKLVPMSPKEVATISTEREQKWGPEHRKVIAAIDGSEITRYTSEDKVRVEDLREIIERYRYSDVAKVVWAVNYGEKTNYPSEIGRLTCDENAEQFWLLNPRYRNKELRLRELLDAGIIPEAVIAEHAHAMGLKFEIMIRPAIIGEGSSFLGTHQAGDFFKEHPEYRIEAQDGTPIEKLSYAYPEVQEFMLKLAEEAAIKFDIDGLCIAFVRGPMFMGWEKPVADAFHKTYGKDMRNISEDDARLLETRAEFLTNFTRALRRKLDEVGKKKGRRIGLSAWVWGDRQRNLSYELNPIEMIEGQVLDEVILHDCEKLDPEIAAAAKANGCKVYLYPTGYYAEQFRKLLDAYKEGAYGFAQWDIDSVQDDFARWGYLRVAGHPEEVEMLLSQPTASKEIGIVPLQKINGKAISSRALWMSCYSGG